MSAYLKHYPEIVWDDESALLSRTDWESLDYYGSTFPTSPSVGRVWRTDTMVCFQLDCDPPEPGYSLRLMRRALIV